MTATAHDNWQSANQRYLVTALDWLRRALEQHAARAEGETAAGLASQQHRDILQNVVDGLAAPPALEAICATFQLSPFERDLLLLCAGVELDAAFAPLCAKIQGDAQLAYPSFGLALAALEGPHWSAIAPGGPLRRWRLIEIGPGNVLTSSPLRIDERVLCYLVGVPQLDERLAAMVEPLPASEGLLGSQLALAERIAGIWARASSEGSLPAVQLSGGEEADRQAIAAAACAMLGLDLYALPARSIPSTPGDLDLFVRLWEREAALSEAALLVECENLGAGDGQQYAVERLLARLGGPLLLSGGERRVSRRRLITVIDVPYTSAEEREAIWRDSLGQAAVALNGQLETLAAQFSLNVPQIRAACAESLGATDKSAPDAAALWAACRAQARPRLDDLAQRIEPAASWDDLVLPEAQRQILREIALQLRQRARVYGRWGFASKGARGLGISALFAGGSGTGKTMAAEVLAGELRLDLYKIDLSQVVSKYIGETEKNLRRVFDAAEAGGAILLFDEADALFGKRSEVKDSHDRHANIEVSYLLQRMEAYGGLAILTTNMQDALDAAFLRRIRFVVQFPFPDAAQRAAIWRRVFPAATPTEGLDPARLARLSVAGGNIRNIALNAAFLAADEDAPVQMRHLLQAARGEYAKLEKPLTAGEIKEWV